MEIEEDFLEINSFRMVRVYMIGCHIFAFHVVC